MATKRKSQNMDIAPANAEAMDQSTEKGAKRYVETPLMKQYYLSRGFAPRHILLPFEMEDSELFSQLLEQQNGRPHTPSPPSIFASSRTPICLSSILVWKTPARSFTSSRKSTRLSDVK